MSDSPKSEMSNPTEEFKGFAKPEPIETKKCQKLKPKFQPKSDVIYLKLFPDYHLLSMEEQMFFVRLTEGVFGYNEQIRNETLKILAMDYNVTKLCGYLSAFIKDSIHLNIICTDLTLLIYSVRMTKSLLANPHVNLKEHLHEILPAVVSCALSKKISKYYYDNHWTLRDFSAYVVAMICHMYSNKLNNITQRVVGLYVTALKDPSKSLPSVYGGLKGLGSLGEEAVKNYMLPNLACLSKRVFLVLERKNVFFEEHKQKILEAKHVKDAVLSIAAPVLLKCRNLNDGGVEFVKDYGFFGRTLYMQMKTLEKIEVEKRTAFNFKQQFFGHNLVFNKNWV